ncbi:MAG: cation:proton antiporter [Clostridia bacterium]|nr:cation:proton antiporter [Clostridia bacterium]
MQTLLSVSVAMLTGLLMTRVFKPLKLPAVTAYLVAGILIGPYCLGALHIPGFGFTSAEAVARMDLVSEIALGFIAFSIGNEFRMKDLKATGKQAAIIGTAQALVTALFVVFALFGAHLLMPDILSWQQALVLGAIATATAPAATLMVVRQYKAKGPLTKLLLPIVALDDAVGLIVFAVLFGIAKATTSAGADILSILLNPLIEIAASLLLGAIMGWLLTLLERFFNSNTNRLNMTIAFVFLTASLSMLEFSIGPVTVSFSSLLVCMMLGTVFCNICPLSENLMGAADKWTSPLFALFFVVSGASLELGVFTDWAIVVVGVLYILFRSIGKYVGTYYSSKAVGCSRPIRRYLGITLFPQAGVALGMSAIAMQLGEPGHLIRNITLFSILIYELFGPLLTKWALTRAGEITPMPEEVKNRRSLALHAAKNKQNEP